LNAKATDREGQWDHPYELKPGETQSHELSHRRVWVTLLDTEWQVRSEASPQEDDRVAWNQSIGDAALPEAVKPQRFIHPGAGNSVTYLPALASLSTVIRPYQPLTIPPKGECTVYVGTVAWMRVFVGDARHELVELPLTEPARTWVGPSTMDGEVCYTAPSYARLALDAVPRKPWRAITPVRICNQRPEPFLLERFSLPTTLLSLHQNQDGTLWTPRVTVVCETDISAASLKIDTTLIAAAGNCRLLCGPREKSERAGVVRAFDRMFG
jgi:hypothetical protein